MSNKRAPILASSGLTASRLVFSDANRELDSVTLGTGLSLVAGTLGSDSGYVIPTTTEESNWNAANTKINNLGIFNVKDYGALGNNSSNDTTYIQAAIDAAVTAGGGIVFFPKGTYLVTQLAKNFTTNSVTLIFKGAGRRISRIAKYGAGTDTLLVINNSEIIVGDLVIEDIGFFGISSPTYAGIELTNTAYFSLNRVYLNGFTVGLNLKGEITVNIEKCIINANLTGIKLDYMAGLGGNFTKIKDCIFGGNKTLAIDFIRCEGLHIEYCDFEGNGTTGNTSTGAIRTRSTIGAATGYSITSIRGCWFESNYGYDIYFEGTRDYSITESNGYGGENGIYVGQCAHFTAIGNNWPNNNLEFAPSPALNIIGWVNNCVFADITGTTTHYIHILGTDYNGNFHPNWMSALSTWPTFNQDTSGTAAGLSGNPAINPITVNSLTIGYGANSIATNVTLGINVLSAVGNTGVGYNVAIGIGALHSNTSGYGNLAIGWNALGEDTTGYLNLALGLYALNSCVSGNYNICIGSSAGRYELGSNKLYINSIDRSDNNGDKTGSLLYGIMDPTIANQRLIINARVGINVASPNEDLEVAGKIRANTAFNVNGTNGVADGTYTVGLKLTGGGVNGTITTKGGIITAIQQAT